MSDFHKKKVVRIGVNEMNLFSLPMTHNTQHTMNVSSHNDTAKEKQKIGLFQGTSWYIEIIIPSGEDLLPTNFLNSFESIKEK